MSANQQPPHYPVVPRVGIRGKIGALTVTGEEYLAITPACLMAGKKLEAVFETDIVTATFVAYAHFLVAWAPFYYDVRIGIGIAATLRLLRTFRLELRAELHVWGPPLAGVAHVEHPFGSFTVEFGDPSGEEPPPLAWEAFQQAFLPPPESEAENVQLSTIRITEGLVREVQKEEDGAEVTYRVVNPHELVIETDSAVPCSDIQVGNSTRAASPPIGIRPMGLTDLTSRHIVSIEAESGETVAERFHFLPSQKNYPEALWSPNPASGKPEAGMVPDVPSGAVLRVQPKTPEHPLGPFLIEKFEYEEIPKAIPWSAAQEVPTGSKEPLTEIAEAHPLRSAIRDSLAKRVQRAGASSWYEISMTHISANLVEHFQAQPMYAALGQPI